MADETDADGAATAEDGTVARENGGTDENGDDTVPHVELALYQLSVKVSGQATDDLDDVSETARDLMEYLVDVSQRLEDRPDGRGLG